MSAATVIIGLYALCVTIIAIRESNKLYVMQLVADEAARQARQYRDACAKAEGVLAVIAEEGDRIVYTTSEIQKEIDNKCRKS